VNPKVQSEMSESEEKINGSDYHFQRKVCHQKLDDCIAMAYVHIYKGNP
jgi:hypothetical protein